MTATAACWIACLVTIQVPPPNASARQLEQLRADEQALIDKETQKLFALAETLAAKGQTEAAKQVRQVLPARPPADGSMPFAPLPEVVPAHGKGPGLANVPAAPDQVRAQTDAIRKESAKALFDLAAKAAGATPKHLALADECLRAVIARDPDHAEARRLLGHVKHDGGWATPHAVVQFQAGMTLHPTYGWVRKSWIPHLEKGELPLNGGAPEGSERWAPAAQADGRHADWRNAWTINTEHFQIRTNVPLAESIAFGRHLETLHDVFNALFADVIGENLPLAVRYRSKTGPAPKAPEPHYVSYFAERQEYVDQLRAQQPNIEESLGLYLPPKRGSRRGHAYFFRDKAGELGVTDTLFHEVSHQLLFESGVARPDAYKQNAGNFWVFEGLGTYFETLRIDDDGSVRIGGLIGARNEEAIKRLRTIGAAVPMKTLVQYDSDAFNAGNIFRHYQQASALTTFFMHAKNEEYRDGFLMYVRDACKGALRRGSAHTLEERIGVPAAKLDAEFAAYLNEAAARQ